MTVAAPSCLLVPFAHVNKPNPTKLLGWKKFCSGLTLVHWGDVWVLHVMTWHDMALSEVHIAFTWARKLWHDSVCTRCSWAECKHIGRLPVWVANWGEAPSQREGSQWKEQREGDAQTDADPGRGEKEERQPRGDEMRRQRDAATSEKMLRQSEEQTSRLQWEPAARRSDRDSEGECWFTAANWVENLKEETQLTQWQDKWESASNADQERKESGSRKDAQGW